ncbi:unnamed protein product [Polarella glacialis]|uniref:Uncharacterized protein n=1 Tax=Polarella glacialis TaxID=89957 RepID=A0A813KXZ7_POLGL|nr:unnamed protein product [Polarella glacialis]
MTAQTMPEKTAQMTNSIMAPLPDGMDLAAARVAFAHFGEVQSLKPIPGYSGLAAVVFFDIRSATTALQAFGAAGCLPGPQVGDRTVELAGDAELNMKDFSRISEVRKNPAGSFVLEFFDLRDATRYRQAYPEVEAPPGLRAKVERPPGLSPPPGLERVEEQSPAPAAAVGTEWQVIIKGLPGKLLSEAMLEAVLEQAGLGVASFSVTKGKASGEVIVRVPTVFEAQKCVLHFQGCQWDKSGSSVITELIAPATAKKTKPAKADKKTTGLPALSAEAPAFQPKGLSAVTAAGLSAEAPAFVPSRGSSKAAVSDGSDSGSTEVGESEEDYTTETSGATWALSATTTTRPRTVSSSSTD